jgi:hypothetical protein
MRILVFALMLVVAAKLVITTSHGVAVADYPSIERCEQARAVLIEKWKQEAERNSPAGTHLISLGSSAVCIPA